MKIALLSATVNSLKPIENAFLKHAPEIEYIHLLDSDLLPMLEKSGSVTIEIINRFVDLVRLAEKSNVDLIQLTCSAFNDIVPSLQVISKATILRSDEAVLNKALKYDKIGLISTVKETPIALINYLQSKRKDIEIVSEVEDGAIHLLSANKKDEHDRKVINLIKRIENQVDVIVLSQYSIEHVQDLYSSSVPILGAASETVLNLKSHHDKD